MSTVLGFFSSDARDLYKADVFRALALPKHYVLHFRYRRKYIQSDLLSRLQTLKGKEGCIFFVQGNDIKIPPEQRELKIYSIRQVKIEDIYQDDAIELVHFYLRLGEFVDCTMHQDTKPQNQPPNAFVSEISVTAGPNDKWVNRVEAIKSAFQNQLFFYILGVRRHDKPLSPTYSERERAAYFSLKDEAEYQIETKFYDTSGGTSGLEVDDSSSDTLTFNIPEKHCVGTERDAEVFTLHTHTLGKQRSIEFTRMCQREGIDIYSVNLVWHIEKGPWKPWRFGLFTALGALGVAGLQLGTKDLADINLTAPNAIILVSSVLFAFLASALLFKFFNKK